MQQYFASQEVLSPAEFFELGLAISTYDQTGERIELKTKIATALFIVIAQAIDNEREASSSVSDKRREAGKKGAAKRWKKDDADSKEIANDSKAWQNGNAIFAIQSHSEPLLEENQESALNGPSDGSPLSSSPTPPSSLSPSLTPPIIPQEESAQHNREISFQDNPLPPYPLPTRYDVSDFIRELVAEGIDENLARDWVTQRKAKRLSNTHTVVKNTLREMAKIPGKTPNELLEFAVARGWGGFMAEYYNNAIKKEYDNSEGNSRKDDRIHESGEGRHFFSTL